MSLFTKNRAAVSIGTIPGASAKENPSGIKVPVGRVLRVGNVSLLWHPRTVLSMSLVFVALLLGCVVALGTGTIKLDPQEVFQTLIGTYDSELVSQIVVGVRVPRLVTAVFVGACLGVAGAVFQSISRNALGSPDIIGFSTGAATGAVAQIVLFNAGGVATALAAMGGGLFTAALVYVLSIKGGVTGGYRLVLIGIGVSAILGAFNSLLLSKGNSELAQTAVLWLSGSLNARSWIHALPVAIGFVVLMPVVMLVGRNLNLLEMGDDAARQLGIRVERTRLILMVVSVGLTSLATAAAGPIAFIALAAPQLVRRITGSTRVPLFTSAIMGAALLIASDLLTAYLPINASLPIGLMTGLVGGIYLLWLLTRSKQI